MGKVAITIFIALLLLLPLMAQDEDLSDEELEAIAQRDMLEFFITYAPVRFDKNLQVGQKLIYRSKTDQTNLSTIEVVKDTTNAFWIKEEFEGNIVYQLISRDTGELIDIKGYDDEGNFNHPQMLSDREKEVIISKREEKFNQIHIKNIFRISEKKEQYNIERNNIECIVLKTSGNEKSHDILTSVNIPKMLPFAFSFELSLTSDIFHHRNFGLISSEFIELIHYEED